MNIYNIQQDFINILNELENNGGEITPELEQALAINESNLKAKALNYIPVVKSISANNNTIDEEINRLQALKKVNNNILTVLKNILVEAMNLYNIEEIKSETNKINFRKSTKVIIDDIDSLPNDCIIFEKKTIPLNDIKKRLQSGEEIKGARIENNKNIQIK